MDGRVHTPQPAYPHGHGDRDDLFLLAAHAASLAPSMHNTQPWRFRDTGTGLEVRADRSRQLPVADLNGWAVRIAGGAAALNAALALAEAGVSSRTDVLPEPADPDLLARVVSVGHRLASERDWALAQAIPRRHSNRRPFLDLPVPDESRTALCAAAELGGAWLEFVAAGEPVREVAALAREADRELRADDAYTEEVRAHGYGLPPTGTGIPRHAAGYEGRPDDLLPLRDFGGGDRGHYVEFEPAPLVGVLGTSGDEPCDQVLAGSALQRVLLTATVHGLAVTILSQPIEVPRTRAELAARLAHPGVPQVLLRIGYGEPAFASPRLPLREVIEPRPA